MQTQGSLTQTSLASLLETMQSERATGTLAVQHSGTSCSLYFLFGHLFHASGDLGQGEEAVIGALRWHDGSFTFDPRAKLPAEETIKSASGDLLAEAQRRERLAAQEVSVTTSHFEPAVWERAPAVAEEEVVAEPAAPPSPPAPIMPVASPAPARPIEEPVPVGSARAGQRAEVAETWEAPVTQIAPVRGTAAMAAPAQASGNLDAPPLTELYPLPAGKPIYEGLKSAFVDFPKLLRTLEGDTHTGYVRLAGADFAGVLLLHDGHLLEALFSSPTLTEAEEAFQQFRRRMDRGEGLLDVVELSGETVVALAQLLTARPMFTGLLGRFINFDSLLEYLAEERVDGSVLVTGGSETGVILLRHGAIHGAYTESQRDLQENPAAIGRLAAERSARIDVKAGAQSAAGIDVDAALRRAI